MIFNLAGGGTPDIDKIMDDESKWTVWNLIINETNYGTIYYMVTASRIFFKGSTVDLSNNNAIFDLPQKIIDAVGSKRYEIPLIDAYNGIKDTRKYVINYNTSNSYLHKLAITDHGFVKLNSWIDL